MKKVFVILIISIIFASIFFIFYRQPKEQEEQSLGADLEAVVVEERKINEVKASVETEFKTYTALQYTRKRADLIEWGKATSELICDEQCQDVNDFRELSAMFNWEQAQCRKKGKQLINSYDNNVLEYLARAIEQGC